MFWVSSWFPTSPDKWAVFVVAGCILGLIAAKVVWRTWLASKGGYCTSLRGPDRRLALNFDKSDRKVVRGCGNHVFLCLGGHGLPLFAQNYFGLQTNPKKVPWNWIGNSFSFSHLVLGLSDRHVTLHALRKLFFCVT